MAARRGRQAAAEPPPPPPPEPTPEPEPEKPEEPPPPPPEPELLTTKSSISKEGRVAERIIERIIICPGMQNPYGMMGPPGGMMPGMYLGGPPAANQGEPHPPPGKCPCLLKKCSKKSKKKKKDDEPCKHPFCIVQRAKVRPQGLPWASGLYPGPSPQPPQPPQPKQPPVVICQRPVLCCCIKCRPPPESDSEDEPEEDPQKNDTETFMTFMNLVFAASNVINERPEIL